MNSGRRKLVGTAFAALVLALAASCSTSAAPAATTNCDSVVTRCRTVCDPWCDDWGCYDNCYDDCYDECIQNPTAPSQPVGSAADAGAQIDGGRVLPDASVTGILCTPCTASDQCEPGARCIVRGGDAAPQSGFCGRACQSNADCPSGFACTQLTSSRQCLPLNGTCPP